MIRHILKLTTMALLIWCAVFCGYIFASIIIHNGSITIPEPNMTIVGAELALAILTTIGGIIWLTKIKYKGG